jgi:hypothetical protein
MTPIDWVSAGRISMIGVGEARMHLIRTSAAEVSAVHLLDELRADGFGDMLILRVELLCILQNNED